MASAFNPDDQYADVPPPGFNCVAWSGYALREGDMVFSAPCGPWTQVRRGMNLVGARWCELFSVLGIATPAKLRPCVLADVEAGRRFRTMATGGLWMLKQADGVVWESSGAPVPARRCAPNRVVWCEA